MKFDITTCPVQEFELGLADHSISRVLFAVRHVHFGRVEDAIQACETVVVEAWTAVDFFETAIARSTFDVIGGKLIIVFRSTPQSSWELLFKAALNRIGAAILLLLSWPAWLITIVGVGLGPRDLIFFNQERAGLYGKLFTM